MTYIAITKHFDILMEAVEYAENQRRETPDVLLLVREHKNGNRTQKTYTVIRPATRPCDVHLADWTIIADKSQTMAI